jgi:YesN/AraC family two-component response regulator
MVKVSVFFRALRGSPAMEWINKVTIDLSKIHLKEKKLSISKLAHKMGFVEQNSFTRFFKKHTGQTPMEYRNGIGIPLGGTKE